VYEPVETFDPVHTYRIRIEWDEKVFSVSIDGKRYYVQEAPRLDPMDRVKTIHTGANWRGEDPASSARAGGGYRVEMAVPWAKLGLSPRAGLRIGFDVRYYQPRHGSPPAILAWSSEHFDPLVTSAYGDLLVRID